MTRAFEHIESPQLGPAVAARFSIALLEQDATLEHEFELDVPHALSNATKRRRDYLAGRYCARHALRSLAPELADSVIGIGSNREPVWPAGIVGSITHTDGFASAVVAKSSELAGMGIDSERQRGPDAMRSLARHIVGSAESAALKASGLPMSSYVLLAFSAKESIFKCLYPSARQLWELDEVQITRVDVARRTFESRGLSARAVAAWPSRGVEGRFAIRDGYVHTSAFVSVAAFT
jgi:enterobactin synthetase component D